MLRTTKLLRLAVAAATAALLPGCIVAAVAVGAAATYGVIKYSENEASQDFKANVEKTWAATIAAMREQGYPVSEGAKCGPTGGKVEVSDATVHVEKHAEDFTRVRVRIGTFETDEHKRRARLLLEDIAKRLGE
ncbi:MAG: DUF3568 family protein [Planctomycetota bacterium]